MSERLKTISKFSSEAAERTFRWLPLALALLLEVGIAHATDSNDSLEPVLTFVEVRVEMRGHAGNVLRQQANAAREHQASSRQTIVMQEIARPERFAVLERESPAALTADGGKPLAVIEGIADDLIAPPDQRLNREFDEIATTHGARVDASANFYVITHVDIAASNLAQVEIALHDLAAAARQSNGNFGFEILQQSNHPNHFNLVSAWLGEAPFRAFAAGAGARAFRQTVAPRLGSLYDERLFRRVD
jgi:quinol monooxygenase YgiN